jgi:hypothetical protein
MLQDRQRQTEESDALQRANQAAGYAEYAEIITRLEPLPDDAARLDELTKDMGISADRVKADQALIADIRRHRSTSAKYPPLDPAKLAGLVATRDRLRKEFEKSEMAPLHYKSACALGRTAEREILHIATGRPELFQAATPGELPKFISE